MSIIPEPEDVEIVVAGGDVDPATVRETVDFINRYKLVNDQTPELRHAIESLGINPRDYGVESVDDLIQHWRRLTGFPSESARTGQGFADPMDFPKTPMDHAPSEGL